jgi:chromosome segregation ATPase
MPDESEKPALPTYANFPDPRPAVRRPRLQVESIIERTDPNQRSVQSLVYLGVEDCFATLEAEENALQQREQDLAKIRAETFERIRVVRETEILLDAREKLLDDREALLAERMSGSSPDKGLAALDRSLKETRQALKQANDAVKEREEIIAQLRAEMEELKAISTRVAPAAAGESPMSYDKVTHKSLSDQVAFLKEREAFIEESENTLFDKAQHLQEWETRLQQQEHDLESGGSSVRTSENGPIAFPRSASGG